MHLCFISCSSWSGWGREVSGWELQCKQNSWLVFFNYCSSATPFYVLMFHWAFSVGYKQQEKDPPGGTGAGASPVRPSFAFRGIFSFYGGWRGGRALQPGWVRGVGWSDQVPSTKFLPETTACLVTPLFLQIRIVYALINKLSLGRAGWLACFYYGNYFS